MESLKQIRKLKNKSQQEIADFLGMSRSMYSFYESGRFRPSETMIAQLADYYSVPVDVVSGRIDIKKTIDEVEIVETNMVKIPIVRHVRAGCKTITDNNIIGFMEVEENVKKRFPDCYVLNVYGNSMEPEIHDNDKVIVYPIDNVDSGDVAVICLNGDEGTIKRVNIDENGITVIPTNPKYKSITYTPEEVKDLPITICGRVVHVRHDYY